MQKLLKYYSYTFTNQEKRQVIAVTSYSPDDAWAQLGCKLGSPILRSGFAQSGAPIYLGEFTPGRVLTPRDEQIGQQ
jgi:hypothetical protein